MNAPVILQHTIAIEHLYPSPTNPRKRFDEAKLKELAASITAQGVLQPLLVRKWSANLDVPRGKNFGDMANAYEVIAGERRFRASKLAGLSEVPCFVRELTDLQVLHAQVIENLQRDDLHPIEEAEGYESLLQTLDENEEKFTADTIALEIGKSRAYIYGRLKLLDLCQEARDAFFGGKIENSIAQLIARIPTHLLQIEALTDIIDDDMSYRQAKEYIQRRFMLDLATAPFEIKDAKLLEKAGACTNCIKRTGNQPELFDDVKSKDVCTDTTCFAEKKAAHITSTIAKAEANGDEVILKADAKKILSYAGSYWIDNDLHRSNLARLESEIPGDAQQRTYKDALETHGLLSGKKALHKCIIENPFEDGIIEAINIKGAMEALTKAGFKIEEEKQTEQLNEKAKAESERNKKQAEDNARIEAEITRQNAIRSRLFAAIRQKTADDLSQGIVAEGLYRLLATAVVREWAGAWNDTEELLQHYLPDESFQEDAEFEDETARIVAKMTTQQHFLILIDCLVMGEVEVHRYSLDEKPTTLLDAANTLGIDADAIEQEVMGLTKLTKPTKTKVKKGAAA